MPARHSNTSINNNNLLIIRILENSYNHKELQEFIHLCCSISAAYLKSELYQNKIYFPIIYNSDEEIIDNALDLIAPLFKRNGNNSFPLLNQAIQTKDKNDSLFIKLKSVIISKTQQELIERYKKEEPGGYKILRNIRLAPTRNEKIRVLSDQSKTYFYYSERECQEPAIDYLNAELPEIDTEELLELASIICKKYTVIPKILEYILINVRNNNACRDFIPVSSLFKALKQIMLIKTIPLDSIWGHNGYSNNHTDDYNSKIFHSINEYIVHQVKKIYVNTVKIDEDTASCYKSVLQEYFRDMIFANDSNPLPHYWNNGYSDYIKNDNFVQHKTRIEYLVKLCKNQLGQYISEY